MLLFQWIYILSVVHRLFILTNYAQLNPVGFAELSIRLASILEDISLGDGYVFERIEPEINSDEPSLGEFIDSFNVPAHSRVEKCLITARNMLKLSIHEMDKCRGRYSMNKSGSEKNSEEQICRKNSLDDIYLELNSLYFLISVRGMRVHMCIRAEDHLNLIDLKKEQIFKDCLIFCSKHCILKALFYANVARLMNDVLSPGDIDELATLIRAMLEKVEDNVSTNKTCKITADNVLKLPPPLVVERGSDFITVRIDEEHISPELKDKIGWIRLYGRAVDSPNAEVRLTDDKLSGTGLETSSLRTHFVVRDLLANQQYLLAFAAFDRFGSMIGRGMGHSTKKIIATDDISSITCSTQIAEIFYEIGLKEEVIRYEANLWNYFMEPLPESTSSYNQSSKPRQYLHHNYKVKSELLETSSAMLLRQFCLLVLSSVECKAELNNINSEPSDITTCHIKEQIMRINLCDKLLAMFSISKKLKNHVLTMEIFASIVNLTIPIMNHNQFYLPFVEILMLAITTVHGLPQTTWIKIPSPFKISIHHMIASVGFYLLKYYNRYEPTNECLQVIRNTTSILLQMSSDVPFTISEQEDVGTHSNDTSRQDHAVNQKHVIGGKKTFGKSNKIEGSLIANLSSQQIAFEAYKYTMVSLAITEHSLTGTDEPDILMAYIANLPSKLAYKEVLKFSRKTRYLQFAVEVAHKSMVEGNLDQSIGMYKDIREWLRKRNETVLGRHVLPPPSQMNVETKKSDIQQDVASLKDQSTGTILGDEEQENAKKHQKKIKKPKYKSITVTSAMNETQRQQQEEAELKAITVLAAIFPPFFKRSVRRRRFRQISEFEISSRVNLNSSIAISFLGVAQSKIDTLIQLLSAGYQLLDIPDMEDVTKYMLNDTGKILSLNDLIGPENKSDILKITKSSQDQSNDRPRTFRPDMKFQEKRLISEAPKLLSQYWDNFGKAAVLLKKAIILSERGKNWLLLSRACSLSWYSLALITNISVKFDNFINKAKVDYPDIDWSPIKLINLQDVFKTFLDPFYFGSEALMDLMEYFQSEKDIKCFDQDFVENYVLRTLHLLYENRKYEKFVHITLRFTKLTNYTFVNVTHPLLVQCQEGLVQMAKNRQEQDPNWSEDMSKQHIFQSLTDLQWSHIDSSNYDEFLRYRDTRKIGRINLKQHKLNLVRQTQNLAKEASHIKNLMSILTSTKDSWLIFSVPVDVETSLREWKQALTGGNVRQRWTEICQKRQLYLYQGNVQKKSGTSFISFNYIQQCYKELNEDFKGEGQQEYCGLLQRDLGDLYAGNEQKLSLANSIWKESLENLMNLKNPLEHLNNLLHNVSGDIIESPRDTERLVTKYGILTCLEIAGVLARIIRYGDLPMDKRTILCLYSATFYKAVFGTSLSNSDCAMSYMEQIMTLDSVNPIPLLIKLNIASDQSKNDIQDIESQLRFLIDELLQSGYLASTLPLMCFYEHIVGTYFRHSLKCIQIRIQKLDVAIQLKQFSVASKILFQLLSGDKLPQLLDSQMAPSMSKTISEVYDDCKHISDDNNITVLDRIMSRRLNANLAQKIGQTLTNKISTLQAKFLLEVASCINGHPKTLDAKTPATSEQQTVSPKKSTIKKIETISNQSEGDVESILDQVTSKMQWESSKQITLPQLKGLLLQVGSGIIQPIYGDLLISIQKESPHAWRVKPSEADNIIQALLIQAQICRQRHYNRSGARLAMFACRVLDEISFGSDSIGLEYGREVRQLNIRLHLRCNQEIVNCLLCEVGIGQILESSKTSIADLPQIKTLIISAISECDEHNLYQMKAWFVAALAKHAFYSGYESEKYLAILKESMDVFREEVLLTEESKYLYNECRYEIVNFNLTLDKHGLIDEIHKEIVAVHNDILWDIDHKYPQSVFWNSKEPGLSHTIVRNVYDTHYEQLSITKLLLAQTLTEGTKSSLDGKLTSINILQRGLDLIRSVSNRKPMIEVEFLMMIGRMHRFQLVSKCGNPSTAIGTLVEGLKLSISSSGHLGLQKQFFLELALTFIASSRLCSSSFNEHGEIVSNADLSTKSKAKDVSNESAQLYLRLSWLALKCGNYVTSCMRQICHIKSDSSILLEEDNIQKLPLSICFDLYGRFLLGEKRIIFKNEIEEELSRMPEARIARDSEHIDDQVERIKRSAPVLSWSQILSYQEMIIKVTNNQFLSTETQTDSHIASVTRRLSSSSAIFLKEFETHKFLKCELLDYRTKCVPFVPKEILQLSSFNPLENAEDEELVGISPGPFNMPLRSQNDAEISIPFTLSYGYHRDLVLDVEIKEKHPLERMDLSDTDFLIQMFQPPFEKCLQSEEKVILLYCCSKKVPKNMNKMNAVITGWRMVPSDQLIHVYENLQDTAHLLEVLSNNTDPAQPSKSVEGPKKGAVVANTKVPKVVGNQITLPPRSEMSDIELKIRITFDNIVSWTNESVSMTFAPPPELVTLVSPNIHCIGDTAVTLTAIPFELNVENIRALAHLFNPIHSKPLINNQAVTKFILDCFKIDFL